MLNNTISSIEKAHIYSNRSRQRSHLRGEGNATELLEQLTRLTRVSNLTNLSKQHIFDMCENTKQALFLNKDMLEKLSHSELLALQRIFNPFVMSSNFLKRCFMKPRGYAGDFKTIKDIYENAPAGSGVAGKMIDEWALGLNACQAVRYRRNKVSSDIGHMLRSLSTSTPLNVTSLAIGPAQEIFDIFNDYPEANMMISGIDIDEQAIGYCNNTALHSLNDPSRLRLFRDNLIKMALGRSASPLSLQDFVYSMGLIDYFKDPIVVKLIDWAFDQLKDGGTLALGNFAAENKDKPFMDHVVDWKLIHRTPAQMQELFAKSKFGQRTVHIDQDPTGIQLFAYCKKT